MMESNTEIFQILHMPKGNDISIPKIDLPIPVHYSAIHNNKDKKISECLLMSAWIKKKVPIKMNV